MKVITTKVPDKLTKRMEEFMKRRGYPSQSEFVRDAIRRMLEPELDEGIMREIVTAREQVRRGETVPLEKLERSLKNIPFKLFKTQNSPFSRCSCTVLSSPSWLRISSII